MANYRFYVLDKDDQRRSRPGASACPGDAAAVEKATPLLNGRAIEVWDHSRRVFRLEPIDKLHSPMPILATTGEGEVKIRLLTPSVCFPPRCLPRWGLLQKCAGGPLTESEMSDFSKKFADNLFRAFDSGERDPAALKLAALQGIDVAHQLHSPSPGTKLPLENLDRRLRSRIARVDGSKKKPADDANKDAFAGRGRAGRQARSERRSCRGRVRCQRCGAGGKALSELEADPSRFSGLVTDINLGRGPDGWEIEQAATCLMSFPKVDLSKIVRVLCNGAGIPLVSSLRDRLRNPATRRPMFDPHPAPNCSYLWQKVGHCIPLWAGLQSTVAGHTVDFQRGAILDSGSVMSVAPPHRLKGRVPPERRPGADAAAGARRARVFYKSYENASTNGELANIREFPP